jgi:hypothetical protein
MGPLPLIYLTEIVKYKWSFERPNYRISRAQILKHRKSVDQRACALSPQLLLSLALCLFPWGSPDPGRRRSPPPLPLTSVAQTKYPNSNPHRRNILPRTVCCCSRKEEGCRGLGASAAWLSVARCSRPPELGEIGAGGGATLGRPPPPLGCCIRYCFPHHHDSPWPLTVTSWRLQGYCWWVVLQNWFHAALGTIEDCRDTEEAEANTIQAGSGLG